MHIRQSKKTEEKYKIKKRVKLGRGIILVCILVYLFMFIYAFFGQLTKTYIVNYGKIEDVSSLTGYVIRREEVICSNSAGILKPVKNEGERVAKGSVVATVFKEATKNIESSIEEIDEKIQRTIKEHENNKLGALIFSEDIRKINEDTEKKVFELCTSISERDFSKIVQLKTDINNNLRKRAEINGEFGPASQYISQLKAQKKMYEDKLNAQKENIRANCAGVVSYNIDGLEKILLPDSISGFNIKQLSSLESNIEKGAVNPSKGFKIIDNFECFISVIIEDKNRIAQIKKDKKCVGLRFPEAKEDLIPAEIKYVLYEEDGKALITFRINKNVESLLNTRKTNVDVVWSTCQGLKVPISSLVKKDCITVILKSKDIIKGVRLQEGALLKVKELGEEPLAAVIYNISTGADGKTAVSFKLDRRIDNLAYGSQLKVELTLPKHPELDFTGEIISASTEQKDGVMVVEAGYTNFIEVDIIKKDSKYTILKEAKSVFDDGISLYDEIILNGVNMEEGRQIRKWNF